MTKEIPLTKGMVALVDDEDYERLSRYKWHIRMHRNTFYARRRQRLADGKKRDYFMHSFIIDAPHGLVIDHRDGNGLNNCRENLRLATFAQNGQNSSKRRFLRSQRPSRFKGVSWSLSNNKWAAKIRAGGGKPKHLGYFDSEYDAALFYDIAAAKHFGEYARFNLVTHEWLKAIP